MKILIFLSACTLACFQLHAQERGELDTSTTVLDTPLNVTNAPSTIMDTSTNIIDTSSNEMLIDTIPTTDGFYQVNNLANAVPFAYPKINTKNIRFYKRIWRDIDLTNERNYIYATPGASLIEAIMAGIQEGKLTPYSPEDDEFKTKMTARQGQAQFADSVLVPIFDDEGNQIDARMALNEFNPERVTKFRIKEDLFFDKQRGRMETRIIGIAPLMEISTSVELAESVGSTPAFWLYFPQLRYTLVKVDVSDPDRGLYDMSMDDLFVQRKFESKIIRESSPGGQQTQLALMDSTNVQNPVQIEDKIEEYKKKIWTYPKGINPKELKGNQSEMKEEVVKEEEVVIEDETSEAVIEDPTTEEVIKEEPLEDVVEEQQ